MWMFNCAAGYPGGGRNFIHPCVGVEGVVAHVFVLLTPLGVTEHFIRLGYGSKVQGDQLNMAMFF